MGDHGRARSRGDHNIVGILEDVEKVARHLPGFVAVAAVERRLPAAGLRLREVHLVSQAFEHFNRGHPDLGEQLIDNAGDEQRNAGSHVWKQEL